MSIRYKILRWRVIFMNKEIIQICNITIALKFALKTNTKIEYFPFEYEKSIEFLFSKNKLNFLEKSYTARNIEEWFDYCLNLGLEDIKILLPVSSKNLNISKFNRRCEYGGSVCPFYIGKRLNS